MGGCVADEDLRRNCGLADGCERSDIAFSFSIHFRPIVDFPPGFYYSPRWVLVDACLYVLLAMMVLGCCGGGGSGLGGEGDSLRREDWKGGGERGGGCDGMYRRR